MAKMTLGQRIKKARDYLSETLGMRVSQLALAEKCGWADGQTRIANYENDIRKPSPSDLTKISRVTGCRVEWLQFQSGYMTDKEAMAAGGLGAMGISEPPAPAYADDKTLVAIIQYWHQIPVEARSGIWWIINTFANGTLDVRKRQKQYSGPNKRTCGCSRQRRKPRALRKV